jgi:hypothetical protein
VEYRTFCESFNRYCLLLVVRALSQLGVSADKSEEENRIDSRTTMRLNRRDLTLSVLSSGAIQIGDKGQPLMTFSPLPAAVNCARTDEEVEQWLADICSAIPVSARPHSNVLLYLSAVAGSSKTLSAAARMRLQTIGNQPSSSKMRNFGSIPVSPWEIDCVERVARCLRWIVTGRDLQRYPVSVKQALPPQLQDRQSPRWLSIAGNRVAILRHPRPHEWSATDIDGISEASKRALRAAEVEEARVADSDEENRSFRADDDQIVAERRCQKYCGAGDRHGSRERL